jgi:hypothetical protein
MFRAAPVLTFALTLCAAGAAHAGPYGDELTKCLAGKTSDAERTSLVIWMLEEMSANPALKPIMTVTDAQKTEARKAAAALTMRMMTEDCRAPAAAAFKNEGGGVAMRAFWELAQTSVASLARDPAVQGNMSQIGQYLDVPKLAAIMKDPEPGKP